MRKIGDIQIVGLAAPVRHALQGMAALAVRPELSIDAGRVARRLHLPEAALSKCFQRLAARGLLSSRRGPGGGYRLTRAPGAITLAEIASALDLAGARKGRCVLRDRPCSDKTACVIHHAASKADARMKQALSRLTLADLVG
ncbi:MAG: hypothetical protein A2506_02725 [Elusimicrobia bacterium RIFOXYD12_FULL_66_9]|nr:MAG: hypothetical protein A2506_02725 [Elusimicrobia bacterium RIFOXYD12_FULL_66_9]